MNRSQQEMTIGKSMWHRAACVAVGMLGATVVACSAPEFGSTVPQTPVSAGPVENQATVYSHQVSFDKKSQAGDNGATAGSQNQDPGYLAMCSLADSLVLNLTPNGGTMSDHGNSIVFPKGAVSQNVTIRMYPILGSTIAVRFEPEGLTFNPNAKPLLTLNSDCIGNPLFARIVYTDNNGNSILAWLLTAANDQHSVSAYLEHFSRYAVAW